MPDYNVIQMKLNEVEILYVLLEYLPERNRKEKKIWKFISLHKGKLSAWHDLTVLCLMKDDGYLSPDGDTYITTDEGRKQIIPLWNGLELKPYREEFTTYKSLKRIIRIAQWIINRLLQISLRLIH